MNVFKKTLLKKRTTSVLVQMGLAVLCLGVSLPLQAEESAAGTPLIAGAEQINPTTVEVRYADGQRRTFDFYGPHIFRMFQDPAGGILRDPQASPEAHILVENPRVTDFELTLSDENNTLFLLTEEVKVEIDKISARMRVSNRSTAQIVLRELQPAAMERNRTELAFHMADEEYFFGGGMQNGRFSHKGTAIQILNSNNWVDGGVASPAPFYWSTAGYGIMGYTFKPGMYDFGAENPGEVRVVQEESYLDLFVMVADGAEALLNCFYQLTGQPVLLPKFGFYEGHLNAYNRDYWKEVEKGGILFEDGKRYRESQNDQTGIKESLNGEKDNYQFSARAVIDRYRRHDMPLGWLLPNDGYGAGYGQTGSLEGNVQNLKELGDYSRNLGVEIGLWTQSKLHPVPTVDPLLQRDIVREVRDAGVRVLKTDVAWVGAGYSFGLNGVADVAQVMSYYGHNARPFIITLDGWAGTQRYAGLWSGDQRGADWEYIRFHIPTYIGSGLSGQPNVGSDMDGIWGGKNPILQTRDFQWKTFTPMELNMDGWGENEKYPHALGEPAASINRSYLKWKSVLLPYTYSVAAMATQGLPILRAMFLEDPNAYTLGKATQYQFMYGPSLLVAPVYQNTHMDEAGNDVRNGIYLPEGQWVDYFTGDLYEGGRILNNFQVPLWKQPVLVKAGAILPVTKPNNNVKEIDRHFRAYELYPAHYSEFVEYDDDGVSQAYREGEATYTLITSEQTGSKVRVTVEPTEGNFAGFQPQKVTEFIVNATEKPEKVKVKVGKKSVKLTEVSSKADFEQGLNVFFYDAAPNLNRFATPGSDFAKLEIVKNPQLLVRLDTVDVTAIPVELTLTGYVFQPKDRLRLSTGHLEAPEVAAVHATPYSLAPTWTKASGADYYEIVYDGMLYSTIREDSLFFEGLQPETEYAFAVRAVNADGVSDWTEVQGTTLPNPLEFALQGIQGKTSCLNQDGQGIQKLFDFDEASGWHTRWQQKAVPFTLEMDLRGVSQLEKFHYLPRPDAGNGTLLEGTVAYSLDKEQWSEPVAFQWDGDNRTKEFVFQEHLQVRYLRLEITKGKGNFGSGSELYVFKVPGTETLLAGDINHDGRIDMNDFTSFMNYTGLRRGDADFDGYISGGDVNRNGLIDALDISVVGTQVRGGVDDYGVQPLTGTLTLQADKTEYAASEEVHILVKGTDLQSVNALSFALPYNSADYEYMGIELLGMKELENLTYDRLHTNGQKALYPTFVNVGDQETLKGNADLLVLKFKAKRKVAFELKAVDGLLVDKLLNVKNALE